MADTSSTGEPAELSPAERLRQPQRFEPASSFQVRSGLLDYLTRDLLGPWGGPEEELGRERPGSRYLVGQLGPTPLQGREGPTGGDDPDELDDGAHQTGDTQDAELPDRQPLEAGRLWASSMGLSFKTAPEVEAIHVACSWGRYRKTSAADEDGKEHRVWKRTPAGAAKEVALTQGRQRIPLTGQGPDGPGVFLTVEARREADWTQVSVSLVNGQHQPETNADEAWLFQPELTVRALDGAAPIFLPLEDPLADPPRDRELMDAEDLRLRLLYRNKLRYAVGRNVAARAEADPKRRRAHLLRTEWIPVTDVPGTSAPRPEKGSPLELSMTALAEADTEALRTGLAPLAEGYTAWLDGQAEKIKLLPEALREAGEGALADARAIAERIGAGIRLLTDENAEHHREALRAFRFAQRAMAAQRIRTQVAQRRADTGEDLPAALAEVEARGPEAASWRPFQLAFLLLNLPGLADPGHEERQATRNGLVDLLFFPTGGGKTEAYLGLAAFTMALRRLQGVTGTGEDARDASAGVAVFMRYTLRLLTSQQFQRAATLVAAAEVLRRAEPEVFGTEPFRIGLWVGMKVTPNSFDDASTEVADIRERGRTERAGVLQLQHCPWCGETLAANTVDADDGRRRILVYCPRNNGAADRCEFSRRSSPGEGIPVVSVDEEIYRLLPAFVIATVDKLAQLPWKGEAGMLFGNVRSRCLRHGYRHPDLDEKTGCGRRHLARADLPATTSENVIRLRPWDLIIQDELHLISGALGTSVALFESAVDHLLQWPLPDGRTTGPKIVASTATTKRSSSQVRQLYNRNVALFPPPVLDVESTYFSEQDEVTEATPGRRYIGLCAHGTRLKQAEIRLWDTLLVAGQALFDRHGAPADPYMTPVGYFNATRELAGMRRYLDDDVSIRVSRSRDGFPRRLLPFEKLKIVELTSRIASSDINATLTELERRFDPEMETTARKQAAWAELGKRRKQADPQAKALISRLRSEPHTGAVLATSMLQVGVDVSRFGLMVMTGQPKNTAEYIQASSRVGRDRARPGLVVALYNWSRPRDLGHFEDFHHYHDTFYRQVEALSVTPFTRRALDRGATGAIVAAIRQQEPEASPNSAAGGFDRTDPRVVDVVESLAERAADANGPEAGEYLRERAEALFDAWEAEKQRGDLVYRPGQSQSNVHGLLQRADGTEWGTRTVANSMRETEGEAKLLFPDVNELHHMPVDTPPWEYSVTTDGQEGA